MSETLRDFIEGHVATVQPLDKAAALAYWNFTTTGQPQYEEEVTRLQVALRRIYADPDRFARLKA